MRMPPIRLALPMILVVALAAGGLAAGGCAASGSGTPSGTAGTGGTPATGTGGASGGSGGSTSPAGGSGGDAAGASGGATGGAAAGVSGGGTGGTAVGGTGGTAAGGMGGTPTGGAGGTAAGGTGGTVVTVRPTGRSTGCGVAPPTQDKPSGLTLHALAVPACTGTVTSKCVAPMFAPGGALAQSNGNYDFTKRNYALQLPTNYNVNTAYPVVIDGGGCGGGPTESGGGATVGQGPADAIHIGMSYVKMCFADGGTSCSGTAASEPECVNTPEVPYFYALLADVEAKYCVDKSKVYVGGYSSGGWETYTLGCAAADVIRGIAPVNGGLRNHRPACTGTMAALMVTGAADADNPVGPLVMDTAYAPSMLTADAVNMDITSLDSNGSAPARDALLARNGCIGNATAPYDAAFPLCVKYTGCPAATPVVWCSVTGAGHQNLTYQNVTYYPSTGANSLQWNFLSKLP